MLLLRSKDQQ